MKITTNRLKEIIREELRRVNENDDPHGDAFDYDIEEWGLQDMVAEHGDLIGKFWRGNDIIFEFDDGTEYNATGGGIDTDYTPGREGRYYGRYNEAQSAPGEEQAAAIGRTGLSGADAQLQKKTVKDALDQISQSMAKASPSLKAQVMVNIIKRLGLGSKELKAIFQQVLRGLE